LPGFIPGTAGKRFAIPGKRRKNRRKIKEEGCGIPLPLYLPGNGRE
jgi:hypothetical protein